MDIKDAFSLLKQHRSRASSFQSHFEPWLDTTLELAVDAFGVASQQASNIRTLKSDYNIEMIGKSDANKQEIRHRFFQRAITQVDSLLLQLEKKVQSLEAMEKLEALEKERRRIEMFSLPKSPIPSTPPPQKSGLQKMIQHWKSWKIQAWTAVISGTIAIGFGMYKVGYDTGVNKTDKEKVDYYQENKLLKAEQEAKRDSIRRLLNGLPKTQTDSLLRKK